MYLSLLRPLRFDKSLNLSEEKPQTTHPLYAPAKGVVLHGTPYQGGERIPDETVAKLSPGQRSRLHNDPKAAEKAFRKEPALSKGDREEKGMSTPRIGRAERPDYAEPRLHRPAGTSNKKKQVESAEEGRALLPPALTAVDLVTDEEAAELSPFQARRLVKHFNKLPADAEYVAAANAGKAKRGWYADAAKTLHSLFGTDAGRFVALLAATSPQVSVEENLRKAAEVWRLYQEWMNRRAAKGAHGTPTYEQVSAELQRWKDRPGREFNPLGVHDNNIALALSSSDPAETTKVVLSGPKVDSFRRNLLGNLQAATNDVWMSYMGGFKQDEIAGRRGVHPEKADVDIFKINGEYLANTIKLRRTAKKLNAQLQPGEKPWTAAEVQETVWSFFRALAYVGGSSRKKGQMPLDPVQALNSLTHETVHGNADFVTLLFKRDANGSKNSIIRNLEAAGLGPALERVFQAYKAEERRTPQERPRGSVLDALSPDERRALVPVARRAGQHVTGFMGQTKYARKLRPLRFAAVEQPPSPQPMPAPPQAVNPAQGGGQIPGALAQLPPIDEHREHLLAFSPNVDDLSFEDALARSRAGNQKAFKRVVQHINEQVGLKAHLSDAIGDWSDGAENSILQTITEPVDSKTADYLASWYGLLANQKAVLAFTPLHGGLDSVYQIELPQTDLGQIRKSLDKAGIPFRTLVPSKKGTKVVIYDEKRGLRDQVAAWAGTHNATIRESIGQGRFIGGATRTAARAEYRKIITAYEAAAGKSGGQVRTYRPAVQPNHLRSEKNAETPLRKRRSGAIVRFAAVDPLHDVSIPRDTWTVKGELDRMVGAVRDALHSTKETFKDAYRQASKKRRRKRKFAAGEPADYRHEVAEAVRLHGGPYNHASLHKVRRYLSSKGLRDRSQQDRAIRAARLAGLIGAAALEGRYSSPEEREAAIREGDSLLGSLHLKEEPVRYSGVQAPAGGVVVRGLFYPGGKWIPSANLEKASYSQYQHVENQRAKKYRRADGSVSVDGALAAHSEQ